MIRPFNVLFEENSSSTIQYQGKTVYRFYNIEDSGSFILKFSNIKRASKNFQAILILFNDCRGKIIIDGKENGFPKGAFSKLIFWEDLSPNSFEISFILESGNIIICNGSDPLGTKEICHYLTKNCAMHIEEYAENKLKFFCNDHEYDDDFDDLIFDMEIIK